MMLLMHQWAIFSNCTSLETGKKFIISDVGLDNMKICCETTEVSQLSNSYVVHYFWLYGEEHCRRYFPAMQLSLSSLRDVTFYLNHSNKVQK